MPRIPGAIILLAFALLATSLRAQPADVAGTWELAVTTDQGVSHPSVTFAQDGGTLSGTIDVAGGMLGGTFTARRQEG